MGGDAAGCGDVSRFTETNTATGDAAPATAATADDTVVAAAAALTTTAPATGIPLLAGFAGTAPALIVTARMGHDFGNSVEKPDPWRCSTRAAARG